MQKITKISTQKRNKNRFNIFLNEKYAFSVEEEVLIKAQLHKGMELTEADIVEISKSDEDEKTYLMAVRFISYRMRTVKEIYTYLQKKEVEQEVANHVVKRLLDEGILNDHQFALAYVADRKHLTSKGPQVIKRELQEKGVTASIATEAIQTYTFSEQLEKALKWSEREARKRSKYALKKRQDQLRIKLIQKGFGQAIVTEVMQQITFPIDMEEEKEKLQKEADKLYRKYQRKHEGYELKMKMKAALYSRGFQGDLIQQYMAQLEESM